MGGVFCADVVQAGFMVNAAERRAYEAVKERDKGLCQLTGKRAWDICHIIPKGRFPEHRAEERNLICLTREKHRATETPEGRKLLLELMQRRWGYEYPEEAFQRYLRVDATATKVVES